MDFSLGFNKSRYSHNRDFHIDTTSDFGSFQPTLLEFLSPNDTYSMDDFRQLVRNGVMPAPTFGEIKCTNDFSFVPVRDVFPAWDALVSGQYVNTSSRKYIPVSVPTISSLELVLSLCNSSYSKVSIFSSERNTPNKLSLLPPSDNAYTKIVTTFQSVIGELFTGGNSVSVPASLLSSILYTEGSFGSLEGSNLNSADFVMRGNKYTIAVRLNNAGKRLYKIFKGLGYSLDFLNANRVSVLPLFAFFKAWYDKYYPSRLQNWQSTACYKIIDYIYTGGYVDFLTSNAVGSWKDFIASLCDCWYTYNTDFVSANFDRPASNVPSSSDLPNLTLNSATSYTNGVLTPSSGQPYVWAQNGLITSAQLQILSRLTRFVNKNSLIGGRIYEYLKVHFGQSVIDAMFRQSNFIGSFVTDIKLDDTYSQADTLDLSKGTGQALGSRAGTGSGFSNFSFKFDAPSHGFLIGMSAIYADSSYCQGDDPILYMLKRFEIPSAEFDALGYELTPKAVIYDNGGYSDTHRQPLKGSSFGYVPTYSKYKYKRNILNGDMSKRSSRDSFLGFHLDRYITEKSPIFVKNSDDSYTITNDVSLDVPQAGDAWRFILKYPHLCYFNRIFLNTGGLFGGINKPDSYSPSNRGYGHESIIAYEQGFVDDNFTVQCAVNATLWNKLKPLAQSFDTYSDEDDDTTSVKNV